jgi:hypothetical protein
MRLQWDFNTLALALKLASLLTAAAILWKRDISRLPIERASAGASLVVALTLVLLLSGGVPLVGLDFRFFRAVGRDVREGLNPYAEPGFHLHPFLNPPTALPLFTLFSFLPRRAGFEIWTALNLLGLAVLPVLTRRMLVGQGRCEGGRRPPEMSLCRRVMLGLTAALVVSDASFTSLLAGQLGVLTAVLLVAALDAQARQRPALAGACLAIATIKVSTMLPFCLLFVRRADRRAWLAMIGTGVVLTALGGSLTELPERLTTLVRRIGEMSRPGAVNDYSYQGTRNANILGFDHALYRLGMRDRPAISAVQTVAVGLLGAWVAWQVLGERLPRAASCSLVALYAMLFLYHRNYDTVLLVIPLVYSTGRARASRGLAKRLFAASGTAILLVLYMSIDPLTWLTREAPGWGIGGRIVQAVILPYATWLVLLTMILLTWGERVSSRPDAGSRSAQARPSEDIEHAC